MTCGFQVIRCMCKHLPGISCSWLQTLSGGVTESIGSCNASVYWCPWLNDLHLRISSGTRIWQDMVLNRLNLDRWFTKWHSRFQVVILHCQPAILMWTEVMQAFSCISGILKSASCRLYIHHVTWKSTKKSTHMQHVYCTMFLSQWLAL